MRVLRCNYTTEGCACCAKPCANCWATMWAGWIECECCSFYKCCYTGCKSICSCCYCCSTSAKATLCMTNLFYALGTIPAIVCCVRCESSANRKLFVYIPTSRVARSVLCCALPSSSILCYLNAPCFSVCDGSDDPMKLLPPPLNHSSSGNLSLPPTSHISSGGQYAPPPSMTTQAPTMSEQEQLAAAIATSKHEERIRRGY